jgi:hypothetical protein
MNGLILDEQIKKILSRGLSVNKSSVEKESRL